MKAKRCTTENCNQYVLSLGAKDKCRIHFYIALEEARKEKA